MPSRVALAGEVIAVVAAAATARAISRYYWDSIYTAEVLPRPEKTTDVLLRWASAPSPSGTHAFGVCSPAAAVVAAPSPPPGNFGTPAAATGQAYSAALVSPRI